MSIAFEGPEGWIHGKAISPNGTVNFLSVSALNKAKLCLRRYIYHYVHGIKEADSDDTRRGKALHSETAGYLTTGSRAGLSTQVVAGLHMIEPPGPDLLIEHDLLLKLGPKPDFTRENSALLLAQAPLRADGVPITGAIDLMHGRGTNRGGMDVEAMFDPPNTVEVCDHKFPKRMNYAKTPQELVDEIQMAGYGKYVFEVVPTAEWVRLSHLYMPVRGTPRKSTIRVRRESVERSWEASDVLAGCIKDAAKEPDINKIDANTNSCMAFGKECPAASVCTAKMHNSLASIFGVSGAQGLLQEESMSTSNGQAPISPNSLMARINASKAQTAPAQTAADMTQELLRLARQEALAKYPGLDVTLQGLDELGLGMVTLKGAAAKAVAALRGFTLMGDTLNGSGELAGDSFEDPAILAIVLEEAKKYVAEHAVAAPIVKTMSQVQMILPPDAPESSPALASRAPAAVAAPTPQTDAAAIAAVATAAETPKRGRGRPKKDAGGSLPVIDVVAVETTKASASAPAPVDQMLADHDMSVIAKVFDDDNRINLYVDCIVDGVQTKSLWPLVDEMMDKLAERAGCVTKLPDGRTIITDVRLADPNGPVGFGRWRAAIKAFLRETPIEGGNWTFDGSSGEVGGVVVEAMRDIVRHSGGVFVRGAR